MYSIETLDDIKGNTAVIITLKNLLNSNLFPKFTILSGQMGVGKTSAAKVIARTLMASNTVIVSPVYFETTETLNLSELNETYIDHAPAETVVILLEEVHALSKDTQTGLLTLIDNLPPTVYIVATTTELNKLLKPLQSRAHIFDFKRLTNAEMRSALSSYLADKDKTLSNAVTEAIIHKARGIPRDMFKDVDLALDSEIDDDVARELFNYVDDGQLFTVLSTMKSNVTEFADTLSVLVEEKHHGFLQSLRDYWTKFLLCTLGGSRSVMNRTHLLTLEALYEDKSELILITKTLSRSTENTVELDLLNLCMTLTKTKESDAIGLQIDAQRTSNLEQTKTQSNEATRSARLSQGFISNLKL